ncbi:MAG: hypothetical protein JO227_05830 [Acetobacteraceae bacterium]|nr:hypothetical protein [Acetobacteraceae bacterium]
MKTLSHAAGRHADEADRLMFRAAAAPVRPSQSFYLESTIKSVRGSQSRLIQGIAHVETPASVESRELVCYQRAPLIYQRGAVPTPALAI